MVVCVSAPTGALCEERGACVDQPCQNGATCNQDLDDAANYTCSCDSGMYSLV